VQGQLVDIVGERADSHRPVELVYGPQVNISVCVRVRAFVCARRVCRCMGVDHVGAGAVGAGEGGAARAGDKAGGARRDGAAHVVRQE
jgi:hypothetical protein